jgi:hypothetical protein
VGGHALHEAGATAGGAGARLGAALLVAAQRLQHGERPGEEVEGGAGQRAVTLKGVHRGGGDLVEVRAAGDVAQLAAQGGH